MAENYVRFQVPRDNRAPAAREEVGRKPAFLDSEVVFDGGKQGRVSTVRGNYLIPNQDAKEYLTYLCKELR